MQQPTLRSENIRKIAIGDNLPTTSLPPSPFIEARLAFEKEIVAKSSAFSGGLNAAFRPLRVPALNPQYAWSIAFTKNEYWENYLPSKGLTESDATYNARVTTALEASPFFKWRYNNELLRKKTEKPLTLATWFLTQPQGFIKQPHPLLFVLEVLRSATGQQIEEMAALYPNLLLPEALIDCPLFAKHVLAYQDFKTLDHAHAISNVFKSVEEDLLLQEFFNKHMLNLAPEILTAFLKDHLIFAYQYFIAQRKDSISTVTLRCLLNTTALAPLNADLIFNAQSVKEFEARKKLLALDRLSLHEQHLRTAFLEINAQSIANNINIFAHVVTRELLLALIKKDDDDVTDCVMRNFTLYEPLFFADNNIISELDLSKPHLAARFVQYIPVKKGLALNDAQLAALAKRTDESTLAWLVNYFPNNPAVLTRLILQERSLLEYVLMHPSEEIIHHLINDFPVTEARPTTLLTSAMTKLDKYYSLNKDQLSKILRLCDDNITNWLFKHESRFPAMRDILQDEMLTTELREINPRFFAHTVSEQNTSYEIFFDLILNNPKFVERMTHESPGPLQCYIAMAKKYLEHHINADPILTVLRTTSVTSVSATDIRALPTSKSATSTDVTNKINALQKAVTERNISFDDLVHDAANKEGVDKLARYYVLYTFKKEKESVADKELKDRSSKIRPAKVVLGELLINACMKTKNYDLLAFVLNERDPVNKTTWRLIGENIVTPINYLDAVNTCFINGLRELTTASLLELLANQALCTVVIKFYHNEIKTQLSHRAEHDASFTLLLLSSPEMRLVFDSRVHTIGGNAPQPLLTMQEQQAILTQLCNRTENASTVFAANPTLLNWAYSKLPDRIKNIVVLGLDTKALAVETVLRTPEFTQIFTPDELLSRVTPAQAKASLHYRHVLEMFNDESKLRKLLAKAQLSSQDLLHQLFKLETGNYHYLHTRALLRVINGEADVNFPKPPTPRATSISGSSILQRESSISAFKPYAIVSTSERQPSASDAATISVSSPLSLSTTLPRTSGSDIAKPVPLSRIDSLNAARSADIVVSSPLPSSSSQSRSGSDIAKYGQLSRESSSGAAPAESSKSPSGSLIKEVLPTTPVRGTTPPFSSSPPPPPSGNTTPIASVVLPISPVNLASQTAATSLILPASDLPAGQTQLNEINNEKTILPSTVDSSSSQARSSQDAIISTVDSSAAQSSLASVNNQSKETPVVPVPTESKPAAIKGPPPPPPVFKAPPVPLSKPVATQLLPAELAAQQPARGSLLDAIHGAGGKAQKGGSGFKLKKPAAKGPGLFDNSAAAAALSDSVTMTTSTVDMGLITLIETTVGKDKIKEIQNSIIPLINQIRTADLSSYEKHISQLTEMLNALSKPGLEGSLALALSNKRQAWRPASTYGADTPPEQHSNEWDDEKTNKITEAKASAPPAINVAKPVNSKIATIIAEVRRLYPSPAPATTPTM